MPLADVRISLPDRYRVVRHVANGGMASVWAAEDGVLGRLVAVKVLASHVAADPSSRKRFEREARTAARVSDHPNVATIYDVGEHDGIPFIVMELYGGGSLADRLRGPSRVPQSQALAWLGQAAAALDYAHGEGIVHRDVKPANLLLDDRGRLAVGDFGIARLADDSSLTQAGQVLGTAAYLSPEQALGRPATAASDRYALGIVAFELLAGRRPFGGDHVAAQARQHVEAPPPDSALGAEVDEVLHRAIAKDPDERYLTASRFVDELAAVATRSTAAPETEATRAIPVQRAAPAPAPAPSRPAAPAAAAHAAPRRGDGSGRRGWIALAVLAAAIVLVGLFAAVGGLGGDSGEQGDRAETPAEVDPEGAQDGDAAPADPEPSAEEPAPPADPAPDNEPEGGAGPSASGENPRALNDRGFALLQGGDPAAAVEPLQAAVQGFEQQGGSADPTQYGYALYNLAEALRRSGRPEEAIRYYERRLQVSPSDRPEVVRASLAEAKQAAGRGGGNGKEKGKDKDKDD